jgi:hypothetical protein
MTLREILDKRKEDARPAKHGPRKNRPWGRLQRRFYREEHGLPEPGPYYGVQLHYKNAAARRKYKLGLDAIMASGAEGEALEHAIEDLQMRFCKHVNIYAGLDRRVRQELRSKARREDRLYELEYGSGRSEGASSDDPTRTDA